MLGIKTGVYVVGNRISFSWLALGFALLLALLLGWFGLGTGPEQARVPLLLLLFMSEFGALLAVAGAVAGALRLRRDGFQLALVLAVTGCALVAVVLALMGIALWPGSGH